MSSEQRKTTRPLTTGLRNEGGGRKTEARGQKEKAASSDVAGGVAG
jgi:hypothetical protein